MSAALRLRLGGAAMAALLCLAVSPPAHAVWNPFEAADSPDDALDDSLLAAGQALRLPAAIWEQGTLLIGFEAAPGYYFYQSKIRVEVLAPDHYELGPPQYPSATIFDDPEFGPVPVLRGAVELRYETPASPPERIRVHYQGCAEGRVCYAPQVQDLAVQRSP